jgi:hypothetical protein
MNYLFKVLAGLLGLIVVLAIGKGLFLVGGVVAIVLIPGLAWLAYYLWNRTV